MGGGSGTGGETPLVLWSRVLGLRQVLQGATGPYGSGDIPLGGEGHNGAGMQHSQERPTSGSVEGEDLHDQHDQLPDHRDTAPRPPPPLQVAPLSRRSHFFSLSA